MPPLDLHVRSNAGLATELRFAVMRLRRRLARERHPDNDLTVGSMAVLWALHRCGDLTVGALASREQVRPPSMTRTITALAD
ncbi:MAG: MarR family transcriptional regulator, partial [Nocardioidaceae bacterium]|nr:MarR family transcriptional regulator [Nocardioidaceae bacterium]